MAAASSGRAEVDTSRAFRSVKEAVAAFDERFLVAETQFRSNGGVRRGERSSWRKFEGSDHGVRSQGFVIRESLCSKPNDGIVSARHDGSSIKKPPPPPEPVATSMSEAVPMYLVPSSPPFFASSPSLASLAADDDDEDEQGRKNGGASLMVMSSIKKVEEEAARTRQEVAQLKQRLAETELSMATLNAKLHRALSKLAHMEADRAAAERAAIQQRDGGAGGAMAMALWADRRSAPSRQPLGHLLGLGGEADGGHRRVIVKRKMEKQKPIVPLVVPLINDMLFSRKKKRMKEKESVYMKELYSLLRLS